MLLNAIKEMFRLEVTGATLPKQPEKVGLSEGVWGCSGGETLPEQALQGEMQG